MFNLLMAEDQNRLVNFSQLEPSLDRMYEIGIRALFINPFFDTGTRLKKTEVAHRFSRGAFKGSPYAVYDHMSIEDNLLYESDDDYIDQSSAFKDFVIKAHRRGIRVVLDFITNHTSHDFPLQKYYPEWFLYKEDILSLDSPYLSFADVGKGLPWGDAKHTVIPFINGDFYWSDTAQLNWEKDLPPAPNEPPNNPSLRAMFDYFITVANYWVAEFGVDGFRCDLADRIPQEFWVECISAVKKTAATYKQGVYTLDGDSIFIAETRSQDRETLHEAGFDFVYSSLAESLFDNRKLKDYLGSISGEKWLNFTDTYDFYPDSRLPESVYENISDNDLSRNSPAYWAIAATLPGLAMMYTGIEKKSWQFFLEAKDNTDADHSNAIAYEKINEIRATQKALWGSEMQTLGCNGEKSDAIIAYLRGVGKEKLIIIVNTSREDVSDVFVDVTVALESHERNYILKDLVTGSIFLRTGPMLQIDLKAQSYHIFKVEEQWC